MHVAHKRQIYDQAGEEGLKQLQGGASDGGTQFYSNIDPHEVFQQFFSGSNPFEAMGDGGLFGSVSGGLPRTTRIFFGSSGGGTHDGDFFTNEDEPMEFGNSDLFSSFGDFGGTRLSQRPRQDPTIEHKLDLSLEELFEGCTKKMKISRKVLSPEGTTSNQEKILAINVKPGWKAGTKVTFPREGDQFIGRIPSDIVFIIGEKPHRHFTREGNNLKFIAGISLKQALCGGQVKVPKINGGHVTLPLNEVISPDTVEVISGEGMPISRQPGIRGDLLVNFDINFPKSLASNSVKSLKQLLPD